MYSKRSGAASKEVPGVSVLTKAASHMIIALGPFFPLNIYSLSSALYSGRNLETPDHRGIMKHHPCGKVFIMANYSNSHTQEHP